VLRADVHQNYEGRSKGTGVVLFDTVEEAQNAIVQFNGQDWDGRILEVREDRYANSGPFAGRGGFRGGRGDFGGRGGGRPPYGRDAPPEQPPNDFTDGASGGGQPSKTIYVRNLPWSTSNEDLVELFQTIGNVERAEIQYERNGRSSGSGVCDFDTPEASELAIGRIYVNAS